MRTARERSKARSSATRSRTTSPQRRSKWSFSITLILYHKSTDSGERQHKSRSWKSRFARWWYRRACGRRGIGRRRGALRLGRGSRGAGPRVCRSAQMPVRGEQIVIRNFLDVHRKSADSGERQQKSRSEKRRFDPAVRLVLVDQRECLGRDSRLQGYLAHSKQRPPRTLQ